MNAFKKYKNYILLIIILIAIGFVLIPQLDSLKESLLTLRSANTIWVLVALVVFFSGVFILTLQYMTLAIKKLVFDLTLQVECSELFVSRILPSGVGTVALNMYYLTHEKHSASQATAVVAANGLSNAIAYSILIFVGFLASGFTFDMQHSAVEDVPTNAILLMAFTIIVVSALLYHIPVIKQKSKKFFKSLLKNVESYKDRPKSIAFAVVLNGLGSLTGILTIYLSAKALSIDLSVAQALLTYTAGNIMASLVPTPGGLGSAEAGIFAGLTISGLSSADAISVTMLYRLISFWIPLIPGYVAFWHLRKSVLSDFSLKPKV